MRLTIFCIFFLLSLAVGAAPVLIVLAVVYAVACWQAKAAPDTPPPFTFTNIAKPCPAVVDATFHRFGATPT